MPLHTILERARAMLSGRKPMGRKKARRRGPAGESRDYRVTKKSPVGKAQARSRRQQSMLDELD
jgi:hypothetical protein